MPWELNQLKEAAINSSRAAFGYESPFIDYEVVQRCKLSSFTRSFSGLKIDYDSYIEWLDSIVRERGPCWQPLRTPSDHHYTTDTSQNLSFPEYDAFMLDAMIWAFKPQTILELGSGMSTRQILDSCSNLSLRTSVTCVDKYASRSVKEWLDSVNLNFVDSDIVELDLEYARQLSAGDILFVDSSHVLKPYGDVEFIFLVLLPQLANGVVVHVHDIFLPYTYPDQWLLEWKCSLTENQLLGAFLHNNMGVRILSANHYNSCRGVCIHQSLKDVNGGSFWFEIVNS